MMDLISSVPRLPRPGETVAATKLEILVGGKGFNQAVAAARSGATTAMVGCLGVDPFGDAFLDALDAEGIDAAYVVRHGDRPTGVGMPQVDPSGENAIVVAPGANLELTVEAVTAARSAIAGASVLLLQLEVPTDVVATAARLASESRTTVVLNPSPLVDLDPLLMTAVDVLVLNEVEGAALSGLPCQSDDEIEAAARFLLKTHDLRAVALTVGPRGAVVVGSSSDIPIHLGPHEVTAIDTVGAGDAFCGALGARLAAGDDLASAARYANAAGALAVTRAGAAPAIATERQIRNLLG